MKKIGWGILVVIGLIWAVAVLKPEPAYTPYTPPADFQALAQAYAADNVLPLPTGWDFRTYTHSDGTQLRWGIATPEGSSKATLIFIPGYTGALEMYSESLNQLIARDYTVIGMDLRGQGGSERMLKNPEKLWIDDLGRMSGDVAGFTAHIRAELGAQISQTPLVLIGQSLAGLIVTRALQDHDMPIDGAFLQVPALQVRNADMSPQTIHNIARVLHILGFGKSYAPGQGDWQPFTQDFTDMNWCGPNRVEQAHVKDALYTFNPGIRVGGMTNTLIAEVMGTGFRVTEPERLQTISHPVFMVTAGDDVVVDSQAAQTACRNMPQCQLLSIPKAGHCIDYESQNIKTAMFDGLDNFVAGLSVK